jgi:DNA-binding NarL/FixJ family response regulator
MTAELLELSAVIANIYDAAIDPPLWTQALEKICTYLGGSSAALFWHDAAAQRSQALYLFNDDPGYTRLYFEKYLPMDPFFPATSFIEAGLVHRTSDIVPRADLEDTRFYKEWIEPQGIVDAAAVNLEKGLTRSSHLAVRTDATYGIADDRMLQRFAALVPHLQRAVNITQLIDQAKQSEKQSERATEAFTATLDHVEAAVFLVDADGMITFANEAAKRMLADATLVQTRGNALRVVAATADSTLHDLIASAAKGDVSLGVRGVALPLTDDAADQWFAHILPLTSGRRQETGEVNAAVAAIFIRNSAPNAPPPLEAIAKRYKLTASEARVLDTVLKVKGVKAIASTLGLSEATVKTHLQNLFRKTGTKRQGDLMSLVTGL